MAVAFGDLSATPPPATVPPVTVPPVTEPPVTEPPVELGDALVHLLRIMERTGAQLSARRQDGLEKASFTALVRLVHDGPQRSRDLAESVLSDPSTISRHVAHLVSLGLVERQPDPADGRATVLAATEAGVRLAAELRQRRNATIAAVVDDWPPADRGHLAALLSRFTGDLERHRPALLAAECGSGPARGEKDPHEHHR